MSITSQMGAIEHFTWILPDGDTMTVTVDRGKLALALQRAIAPRYVGASGRKRITMGFGAIVAKREKTK